MLANEVINDLINRLWINVNKIAEIPNQVFKVLELDDTMRTLYDIVFYGCLNHGTKAFSLMRLRLKMVALRARYRFANQVNNVESVLNIGE